MPERVRVGVVGTSWWADMMHLPSLSSHPRAEIVALCGRNADRAREMATKYDVPHIYQDYQEMIERADLQAIVISTPDDLHHPMTLQALDAGLHVMCEKPLALTAAQAKEMYEKAEAAGVKHMTLFSWRYPPNHQHLRKLVADGYIGRGYHAHFRFFMGYGRDPGYQWRFDRRRANGVLGDAGSHMVDLARLLCGDISSVCARLDTFTERRGADGSPIEAANDSALLSVKFANGMTGMIHVSAMAYLADRVLEQRISLHGESGTLESELIFAGADARRELRGARSGEARIQPLAIPDEYWDGVDRSAPSPAPTAGMFMRQPIGDRQFIDAIVEDRPASPSFYEAWKVQEILEAALESDRTGCTVSISADVGQR